jgi:predicted phage terminase large subunit-like protein
MLTPIGPTSPVKLPTLHRADGDGAADFDIDYWLTHPADALDEIDRIECEESLLAFTRRHWHILEPGRELSVRWPLEAVCEHLEAISYGQIKRLLINVPPGFMKSLLCNVFWPAWEWGALGKTSLRYVNFSYSAHLTQRDNRRFRDVLLSHDFGRLFGDRVGGLEKAGETLVSNTKTGWKLATSVGGVGTGERGDRVVLDDPHNVKEGESEDVRTSTTTWFREAMNNRVNDRNSAIVVIMQRVHEEDVSGVILSEMRHEYEHLCIPYEWEGQKLISTVENISWNEDPRQTVGEEAWPARLPTPWRSFKVTLGPYAVASQYQQRPSPRGGGIIKRDWWQLWDPPPALVPDDNGNVREVQRFPQCEFVVASLDGAFGEKQENDWTALTVWGVFRHAPGVLASSTRVQRPYGEQVAGSAPAAPSINPAMSQVPQLMLMHAWRKRRPLNGYEIVQDPGESDAEFKARQMGEWGIVQWVIHTCKRFGVNMLLVEAKANGIDVANEVKRQMVGQRFGVKLIDPGKLDKVARAYAVQHIWADRMVWYPDREWADEVISEMSVFPKGGHDDYTDTATQAAKWLRDIGVLQHAVEMERELAEALAYKSPAQSKPLYPI